MEFVFNLRQCCVINKTTEGVIVLHNTLLNSSLNRTTHTMTIWQDTSPSKGYPLAPPAPPPLPPQYILRYPFIHLGVVKHYDSEVYCTRTQQSHPSEACTRTFSIRCQNTNHWITTPPIYYLNKCTLENLRICISKPWLLKCQSIMTEKMFRIVSVLNESIEMMLKCLRNRGVISFLPPPGGPMADTSNWSTSFRIDVSFLEAKWAMRYKANYVRLWWCNKARYRIVLKRG